MAEYLTALGILTSVYIADYSKNKKDKKMKNKLYKDERNPLGFTKSVRDIVKMITFSNKDHLNKKRKKTTGGEFFVSPVRIKKTPPKAKGQTRRWHWESNTSINFGKKLRRLQPQGDSFFGPMLADVSATRMSVLT